MEIMQIWVAWMVFGHILGDYWLQPAFLALNKKNNLFLCVIHCFIYSIAIATMLAFGGYMVSFKQIFLIYISHVLIDSTPIIDWYMKLMRIRSWDTHIGDLTKTASATKLDCVYVSFGSIVYVVIDNSAHLFITFLILLHI